uniref:Uncharacterized protein n=1 Tax=Escherichia coli TaxID=562 RepID=A0A8F1LAX0_ECOLX|nr:hypothetical protein IHCLGBEB_00031 [Escherichia coli]
MVTLKAHILPHHDLQPPGCRGSGCRRSAGATSGRLARPAARVQLGFAEVADARREASQQAHQGKDVIGEAGRVGVVLLDPQVGLVVQQAVEHIGGIADADIHHAVLNGAYWSEIWV